jgi:hypothetical protein
MASLDVSRLEPHQLATGTWAAVLLHSLARDEAAGRRPQRLTEPNLATWSRFHGRLTAGDLVALLFEDAAVLHRVPFDPAVVDDHLELNRLPDGLANDWLGALASLDLKTAGADYVGEQARLLGVSTKLARSDLHVIKAHQKVLELTGTGGQLAHHLVSSQRDLTLQDNFTIACASWQELTLAGVMALDLGAPHPDFISRIEPDGLRDQDHPLRQRSFDFVVGVHPDKGGAYRVQDQLAIWFPTAKVLLV